MKKTLSLAVCALALASVAEPQKLLEITFADRASLLSQAAQLGNMTATPMIGVLAAGALAENPLASEFGAPRDGEVTTLRVYGESIESVSYAVVYPASEGPAAYEAKKGIVPTNGIYAVRHDQFVAYTSDGKWAVAGSSPEVANLALAKAGTEKLAQGEAVRLDVTPAGLALAADACEVARAACPNEAPPFDFDKDAVKHLDGISLFLRVTEKGLDLQYSIAVKPDSPYAKAGTKPFSVPDPLAFAGKDAILAFAAAADCGEGASGAAARAALAKLCEKYAPPAKILACEKNGAVCKATLDMKALFDFMQTEEAAKWVERLSDDAVLADIQTTFASLPDPSDAPVESPESFGSFAIKGQEFASTAAARFAKAIPEAKAPFAVGVFSVYGGFRHAISAALDADTTASDEDKMAIEMARGFLMALPPEGDGCFATAMWREGPKVTALVRATPEELKGLAALVNLASSMIPFGAAAGCGPDFGEELPDDEEE